MTDNINIKFGNDIVSDWKHSVVITRWRQQLKNGRVMLGFAMHFYFVAVPHIYGAKQAC